jgi:ribose transport system permease protein
MSNDGQSLFFAESWTCTVSRYWFDGPKKGTIEPLLTNLPGYPDNINRASDGNYWAALLGMRTPALDLSLRMPGFRRRMARRVAPDQWIYPNVNTGCVVKFNEKGEILESLWDFGGENHPMITSMREHKGYLYLGGVSNNRIGRYKIPGADPTWVAEESYWGAGK